MNEAVCAAVTALSLFVMWVLHIFVFSCCLVLEFCLQLEEVFANELIKDLPVTLAYASFGFKKMFVATSYWDSRHFSAVLFRYSIALVRFNRPPVCNTQYFSLF